jgi:PD-(D/E)XK nuclease superfamily
VHRQYERADMVILVDDRLALLIEDKIHAEQHGDQLERYKALIASKFPQRRILPTFVKTGDQSGYLDIERAEYRLFLRNDLLEVLRAGRDAGVTNAIFVDFLSHLEEREAIVRSYVSLPISIWTKQWEPWKGLYEQLAHEKKGLDWGYVNTPTGGFLGAWWHDRTWEGCNVYLQIEGGVERGTLCFKISVVDKTRCADLRHRWYTRLMESNSVAPLPLKRPQKFGAGWVMTVASIEQSSWMAETPDGRLDMVATLTNLRSAEQLIDTAASMADAVGIGNPPDSKKP